MTLHLKQIKIKDFDKWSKMKTDADMDEVVKDEDEELKILKRESMKKNKALNNSQTSDNVLRMDQSVKVTFHKMNLF